MNQGFHFYTHYHLIELLKFKSKNVNELLQGITSVPINSIYYHTHRFLQQHHYLSPEPPNDFAYWTTEILNLKRLGEAFASVDTISYTNLEDLRNKFIDILNKYIKEYGNKAECSPGNEFHFMSCKTIVIPTPYIANNLKEFAELLNKITINSLYFHIFEARLRLHTNENDFSAWFKGIGKEDLANEVAKLDPYHLTLESLRKKLYNLVVKYVDN